MSFEWYLRNKPKAQVLGVSLKEGEAIYLWLRPEGSLEPRNYVVPWNLTLAEKLEDLVEDAVKRDQTLAIINPFLHRKQDDWGSLNIEIVPPPLPPMKRPVVPPQIFNPRDKSI